MSDRYEDLNQAIDDLLAERRPRGLEVASPEEVDLLKAAALFKAARPGADDPDPAFINRLADRLDRERRATSQPAPSPARRRLMLGGLAGAAASLLAGIGLGRLTAQRDAAAPPPRPDPELVGAVGRWFPVAQVDQVPPGMVLRVRAGAIEGFVMNRGGTLVAMSAICTHMGCVLSWRKDEGDLLCPCHGVTFHTDGTVKRARLPLKPLPPLRMKVEGETVYLWAVDDLPPSATS
ncbi:MAG: Rieske (2Fe-2S) protein [Chloroflexi bacterium]|nr:Rieske (2Fe-2S) protein [Chloroflexota bacterium]